MQRLRFQLFLTLATVLFVCLLTHAPCHAQDAEPTPPDATAEEAKAPAPIRGADKWDDNHSIPRAKRPGISWIKLLPLVLLYLVWVRSVDWVNRDSQIYDLGYGKWNLILFLPFLLAIPLLMINYIVGLCALLLIYLGTFIGYTVTHNKQVQPHQKVFTSEWFRYQYAAIGNKFGMKIDAERKAEYEKGAQVDLIATGGNDPSTAQANLLAARQSPGYLLVKEMIASMADRRCTKSMLDYSQQAVATKLQIDGVWLNGEARDRESGDVMLAVMKMLANLNMSERRKKQVGEFIAKYNGHSYLCSLVTQGVKTGERVMLQLRGGEQENFATLEQLGMRDKLREQWLETMSADKGLLVISAPPEGGLTTLFNNSLTDTDRLMRDFVSVEDKRHLEQDIENIAVTTIDVKAGETPAKVLPELIRKYPNVYIVRDINDRETAKLLFDEVRDEHLVVTSVRAKEAPEALLRMLQKDISRKDFAATISVVLNTRMIRKLCDECKVGYEPAPELLKKLGIPAGKVEALYRPPKAEEIEKVCLNCQGTGFKGRTGLFELLFITDQIREILVKQPKLGLLRKAARLAGMRTLQEEGILQVARGATSLTELKRVLQQ